MAHKGPEQEYLLNIYQRAVNAEAIDAKLRDEQEKIAADLALMPYNRAADLEEAGEVAVSDDSISDFPLFNWEVPPALTQPHVQRLMLMWLNFARQNMRLKEMVSDIVASKARNKCQKCKSDFRLQVVQKLAFNEVVKQFRRAMAGLPFSRNRWRTFYARHQVFVTLCMECAYIDNLKAQNLKEADEDLQKVIAENAIRNMGMKEVLVKKNLKKFHVKAIIMRWVQLAKSNLLHKQEENNSDY